jgi:hypothetical protein
MILRLFAGLLGMIALSLVLPACSDDDSLNQPCDTCPEEMVHLSTDCDTCDVAVPIGVAIENRGAIAVNTDVCSWRLMAVGDEGWQEVQRLDCSVITPVLMQVAPGATEVLSVELDPDALPPLDTFERYSIEVTLRWMRDGEALDWSPKTEYIELVAP